MTNVSVMRAEKATETTAAEFHARVDALLPLIEGQGIEVGEIDVDADPRLESVYGERVPVLFAGAIEEGQEICALRLDRTRVMAALAATRR